MGPWQSNQFGRIVFILNIVRFGIGIEPLHTGQNPRSIFIRPGDLCSHLLSGTSCQLIATAFGLKVGRSSAIKVGSIPLILGISIEFAQKSPNAGFFVHLELFKVTRDGHGQLGRRCFRPYRDT
jgi:hypothetical protein